MDRKEAQIAELDLFSGCRRKDVSWVASNADSIQVSAGETLAFEGRAAKEFVVVLEGTVADGDTILGPGEFFGHKGLIDRLPNETTVVALTPVRVLVFGARAFTGLLDLPTARRKVMRELVTELRTVDRRVSLLAYPPSPRRMRAVS